MGKSIFIPFISVISIIIFCSPPLKAQRNEFENEMDSLINILPKQKEDSIKAMNLMQIATYKLGEAQKNGKWDEAIEWGQKALKLSTKVNYMFGLGRCNWILARAWFLKGKYPESIKYYSDAI
jgi:tetratricopeptide (TPR) repeat protein